MSKDLYRFIIPSPIYHIISHLKTSTSLGISASRLPKTSKFDVVCGNSSIILNNPPNDDVVPAGSTILRFLVASHLCSTLAVAVEKVRPHVAQGNLFSNINLSSKLSSAVEYILLDIVLKTLVD